ncbi:MAG: protein kinase domain-containing protein [Myxococcota bacterium]
MQLSVEYHWHGFDASPDWGTRMASLGSVRDAAARMHESAALTGGVLSQRYRIERHIRSSNMSHVYEGLDLTLQRRVAVKILNEECLNERTLCRFFLEARIGSLLKDNPHTVTVTDIGFSGSATPYFVMDYVTGEDLATHLRRRKRVSPERAVKLVLELCTAVNALHDAGVVHRDLKPSNVMLTEADRVCLIDFGVCKLTESDISLTHTGELLGSLHYVPPERWIDPDDARLCGDIWAIAVILYELLSGSLPFKGSSQEALKQAVLKQDLELALDEETNFPELSTVLLVALHKDPRYRYATVPDFAAALSRAAFDAGLLDEPSWAEPTKSELRADEPMRARDSANVAAIGPSEAAPSRRTRRWPLGALAAAGIVALASSALRPDPASTAAQPAESSTPDVPAASVEPPTTFKAAPAPAPIVDSPRTTPAPSTVAVRASKARVSSSTARVEPNLPRPADPVFPAPPSGTRAPVPTSSSTGKALDLTPADLRQF